MCQFVRKITPKGSRHSIVCDCGWCSSCMQKKASRRAKRIKNHKPAGMSPWFVTLSYDNHSVPYIDKNELKARLNTSEPIKIYRDVDFFRYYNRRTGQVEELVRLGKTTLDSVDLPPFTLDNSKDDCIEDSPDDYLTNIPKLKTIRYKVRDSFTYDPVRISVTYYKDVIDFFKRFRYYLTSRYGSAAPMSYYATSEYGPTTCRCHYHLILWLSSLLSLEDVQSLVVKAWPFADSNRTKEYISSSIDTATYVASYVNCSSNVPLYLLRYFPPKWSHSLNFGFDKSAFNFDNVFASLSFNHSAEYIDVRKRKDIGIESYVTIYPKYVMHRYFYRCKGFSRIARTTLYNIYKEPEQFFKISYTLRLKPHTTYSGVVMYPSELTDFDGVNIYMSLQEMKYSISAINRRYEQYFEPLGISRIDYAKYVVDSLITYSLAFYKFDVTHNVDNVTDNLFLYSNLDEYRGGNETFDEIFKSYAPKNMSFDSATFPRIRELDKFYSKLFNCYIKHRKVSVESLN